MKHCAKCQENKDEPQFNRSKQSKDGLTSYCKTCINAWHKDHYKQNKTIVLEKSRERYKKTKSKLAVTRRKYYLKNKQSYMDRYHIYRADPLKRKQRNITASKRDKIRRKQDVNYKLRRNYRTRTWNALKGLTKSAHTLELLGCSIDELKLHLSKQFKTGMTWENYGKWHVDHIIPCSSFDLSIPENQKICFNYKNLEPLWAIENMLKGRLLPLADAS